MLLAALALPVAAQAQFPIGTVLAIKGQVSARATDASVRSLARRDELRAGDVLIVGPNGYGQIKLADDAMIALSANTEFSFDRYIFDGNPATPDAAVMTLVRGCFITISGSVGSAPGEEHRIDTPVATIRVRGTVHAGAFDGTGLYTANYEGGTTVINKQGFVDLGIGAAYDFSRTVTGQAPEGLASLPAGRPGCSPDSLVSFSAAP